MPYSGELVINKINARFEHSNILNEPPYATVDQVVALNSKDAQPPLQSVKGNLNSLVNSVDIMKEVYSALDELKIPTKQVSSSKQKGYTGELMIVVDNLSEDDYVIKEGSRLVQLVGPNHESNIVNIVDNIVETNRSENGFGSTGN